MHPTETRQELVDRLTAEHRLLDAQLRDLEHHRWLSPQEQAEVARLKKLKLRAKDQLHRLRS
jgi:uncharacterized protein YdcH (DUF465 family)